MKKRYSTAGFVLVVLLALAVTGCSSAILGETKTSATGKVAVTLSLPTISPALSQVLANSGSGSRALLFLNSYSLSIYDQTALSWEYSPLVTPILDGPGNTQDYTVNLVPGRTYDIYLYGTNTTENPYGTTVMGVAYDQYITTNLGESREIWITLKPYSPVTLANTPGTSIDQTIVKSVMKMGATPQAPSTFTKIGGEKWYTVTPTSNVFKALITPTSGYVYAALFDSQGMFLSAGVSPSFGVVGASSSVSLEAGVTADEPVYIGLVDIVTSDPIVGNESDAVTVKVTSTNLVDDDFDLWGNDSWGAAGYVSAPTSAGSATITNLKAYDRDFYYFYAEAAGSYTVKVTNSDQINFPGGYAGEISLSGPSGYGRDSSWSTGGDTLKQTYLTSVTVTGPGYYYIDVGLRSIDPTYKFPKLAGSYTLEMLYSAPVP